MDKRLPTGDMDPPPPGMHPPPPYSNHPPAQTGNTEATSNNNESNKAILLIYEYKGPSIKLGLDRRAKLLTVTTMNVVQVGPTPNSLVCPSCHATISTRVEHKASTKTHIIAALLCLFICWPCVCLPYCMESCQNAEHYCPNCNAYLGTYKN